MDIHLLQNDSIKGSALLTLLKEEGYEVESKQADETRQYFIFKNKTPKLILIDAEYLLMFDRVKIQELFNEKHRVILLGSLKKCIGYLSFPAKLLALFVAVNK